MKGTEYFVRILWSISLLAACLLHVGIYFLAVYSSAPKVIPVVQKSISFPIAISIAPASFKKSVANDLLKKASNIKKKQQQQVAQTKKINVKEAENGKLAKQLIKQEQIKEETVKVENIPVKQELIDKPTEKEQPKLQEQQRTVEIKEDKTDTKNSQEIQGSNALVQAQVIADWQGKVFAHLMQHKRYPVAARKKYQQGIVLVSFNVDVSGFVSNVTILEKSKFPLLNREAKAVISRSLPLPVPPQSFLVNNNVVIPINFFLL